MRCSVDDYLLMMKISLRYSVRSRVGEEALTSYIDGLYRLPNFLSKGGRELIPEMLMNDPVKRITIPEIRKDPWFQVNCPPYLSIPWEEYLLKNK